MGKIEKNEKGKKKDFKKFGKMRTHHRHTWVVDSSVGDMHNVPSLVPANVGKETKGKSHQKDNAGEYFVPTKKGKFGS